MAESPLDLAKVLDSKTVEKLYDHALAPAAKQVGAMAEDTLKAFRLLFMAPVQYAAAWQDRFERWAKRIADQVPLERQTQAPANIAGPALLNMRFVDEGSILEELYLNLLTRAIDKDRQKEAHPAYIKIIEQLSPEEARFLYTLGQHKGPILGGHAKARVGMERFEAVNLVQQALPAYAQEDPATIAQHLEHLEGLCLVAYVAHKTDFNFSYRISLEVSLLGQGFLRACLPMMIT